MCCPAARASCRSALSQQGVMDYVRGNRRVIRRLAVVPNGVDLARFAFHRRWRATCSSVPHPIVQIGRYASVKNQLLTCAGFRRSTRRGSKRATRALWRGSKDLTISARSLRLQRSWASGSASSSPVRAATSRRCSPESSVFVMPSRSEGHSVAFLEALAFGRADRREQDTGVRIRRMVFLACNSSTLMTFVVTPTPIVMALSQRARAKIARGTHAEDTAERYRAIARQVCPAVSAR